MPMPMGARATTNEKIKRAIEAEKRAHKEAADHAKEAEREHKHKLKEAAQAKKDHEHAKKVAAKHKKEATEIKHKEIAEAKRHAGVKRWPKSRGSVENTRGGFGGG